MDSIEEIYEIASDRQVAEGFISLSIDQHSVRVEEGIEIVEAAMDEANKTIEAWATLKSLAAAQLGSNCSKCRREECCTKLFPFCSWNDNTCQSVSFFMVMATQANTLISQFGDVLLPPVFLDECFPTLEIWDVVRHHFFPNMGTDGITIRDFLGALVNETSVTTADDMSILETQLERAIRATLRNGPEPNFFVPAMRLIPRDVTHASFRKLVLGSFLTSILLPGCVRASHLHTGKLVIANAMDGGVSSGLVNATSDSVNMVMDMYAKKPSGAKKVWSIRRNIEDFLIEREEHTRLLFNKDIGAMKAVLKDSGFKPKVAGAIEDVFQSFLEWRARSYIIEEIWRDNDDQSEAVYRLGVMSKSCDKGLWGSAAGCSSLFANALKSKFQFHSSHENKYDMSHAKVHQRKAEHGLKKRHWERSSKYINEYVHVAQEYSNSRIKRVLESMEDVLDTMMPMLNDDIVDAMNSVAQGGGIRMQLGPCNVNVGGYVQIVGSIMRICDSTDSPSIPTIAAHEFVHVTQADFYVSAIHMHDPKERSDVEIRTYKKLITSSEVYDVMLKHGSLYSLTNPLEMAAEYGAWLYLLHKEEFGPAAQAFGRLDVLFSNPETLEIMRDYHSSTYKTSFDNVKRKAEKRARHLKESGMRLHTNKREDEAQIKKLKKLADSTETTPPPDSPINDNGSVSMSLLVVAMILGAGVAAKRVSGFISKTGTSHERLVKEQMRTLNEVQPPVPVVAWESTKKAVPVVVPNPNPNPAKFILNSSKSLIMTIYKGDLERARNLVLSGDADVNEIDIDGGNALHALIRVTHVEFDEDDAANFAFFLVTKGINVLHRNSDNVGLFVMAKAHGLNEIASLIESEMTRRGVKPYYVAREAARAF